MVRHTTAIGWTSLALAEKPDLFPSPNKELVIRRTLGPVIEPFNEAPEKAVLEKNGGVCWSYESMARGFEFSWSPDSTGFLFGVTHASRAMPLYYVHLEDVDVHVTSIDLEGIKARIAASLPGKRSASVPKYRVQFDGAE